MQLYPLFFINIHFFPSFLIQNKKNILYLHRIFVHNRLKQNILKQYT